MVRVLHIINGAGLGGITSMILNYYQKIDKEQVHFDFVISIEGLGPHGKELESLGAKFYYIDKKSNGLWKHICSLNTLMKKEHFDAVHVHSNHTSYVALIVAWKNHIHMRIAHGHNAVNGRLPLKAGLSRRVGIILMKVFSTARLGCSKNAIIYTFGKHALKEPGVRILPNAIDIEAYRYSLEKRQEYRKTFGILEPTFVVGCVGRMSPEKNHMFLVELLPVLLEKSPDLMLMLVGDGEERKHLEKRAKELEIEKSIIFAGARSDVPGLLCAMDAFVLPSLNEGLGIVAVEAAAAGLPMVLSDQVPDDLAFIPNAVFLSTNSKEEWVSHICKWKNHRSQEREKFDKLQILTHQGYDIQTTAKDLEKIYMKQI